MWRRFLSWVSAACCGRAVEAETETKRVAPSVSARAIEYTYVDPRQVDSKYDLSGGSTLPMAGLPYRQTEWRDFKGKNGSLEAELERRLASRRAGAGP